MKKQLSLFFILLTLCFAAESQKIVDLFARSTTANRNAPTYLSKFQTLTINKPALETAIARKSSNVELEIPFEADKIVLLLKQTNITTDDFSVVEMKADGVENEFAYKKAVFYHGTVKDKPGSIASVALLDDHFVALISDEESNIVLEPSKSEARKSSNEYLLYKESDLLVKNPFTCQTPDAEPMHQDHREAVSNTQLPASRAAGSPVAIYFECDHDFYKKMESSTDKVTQYVLGFFNSVALLYKNENITVQVSQIKVWTIPDPEASLPSSGSLGTYLDSFSDRVGNFKGDYAHFISARFSGGGIAYLLNDPCRSPKRNHTAVSMIRTTYESFPTSNYSWTVTVVAHELGHNFGSNHTQWCGWPGGAIDNCVPTEPANNGSCPPGPAPVGGGTVMSYCHASQYGTNLSKGFGPLPGAKIRQVIGDATCISNCSMTAEVEKTESTDCKGANGAAKVNTTNATGTVTYLWSTGATTQAVSGLAPGAYSVTVKDAAGCEVRKDFEISSSTNGSGITVSITPSGSTNFCIGKNVILKATELPNTSYKWFRNNVAISGAVSNTYTADQSGSYTVSASNGNCTGTSQPVTLTTIANPVFSISPANAVVEKMQQITITASATNYSYNWNTQPNFVSSPANNKAVFRPSATTSYSITGTSVEGCKSQQNFVITVIGGCGIASDFSVQKYPSPTTVKLFWKNPSGITSDSVYYRKRGVQNWTAILVHGNSIELNGLTPASEYEYRVVTICSATNQFGSSAIQTFSTGSVANQFSIKVYPNPVKAAVGDAKLEIVTSERAWLMVRLYNSTGRFLRTIIGQGILEPGRTIIPINTTGLRSGSYIIWIAINEKQYTSRLVVIP